MILAKERQYAYDYQQEVVQTPRARKKSRPQRKPQALVVTLILFAFAFGLLVATPYALLATTGYKINQVKKEISAMQGDVEQLQLEVARLKSLERVEQIAITKLGMVRPQEVKLLAQGAATGAVASNQGDTPEVVEKGDESAKADSVLSIIERWLNAWSSQVDRLLALRS